MNIDLQKPGIYLIINKTINKIYVGQSINLKDRYKQHKKQLKKGNHFNLDMQNDYLQGHKFSFKPLLNCSIKSLNKLEKKYIEKYDTYKGNGYNKTEGGDSFGVGKNNPKYDNTIYEFTHKDGKTFKGTQYELRNKYKLDRRPISSVCLGKIPSIKGWGLKGWIYTVGNKYTIYEFEHENGKTFKGTQYELRNKYKLNQGNLSLVCSGKKSSVKGWKLKN